MKYVVILVCILIVAFLVWWAFIRGGREDRKRARKREKEMSAQIDELRDKVKGLSRELDENRKTRLNVSDITPILHVAVMNIDSSFTRTYVRENEGMTFNGALRADITAEYGIRLEDVRFRFDESANTLEVANFHPGLISYSRKQLTWEIARSFRTRHIFGHELSAVSDNATDSWTKKVCEEIRTGLEKEIDDRKITEFDWLAPLISNQVSDFLKALTGRPELVVKAVPDGTELSEEGFMNLPALLGERC